MAKYVNYYGKRVSWEWYVILTAADDAGVKFTVTSGKRTMAEQARLYSLYRSGKGNLAAFPTPNAPHIRVGRIDHAIDVNSLDGGETRLQRFIERHGGHPSNPVAGEAWHMEMSAAELRKLAKKFDEAATFPTIRKGNKNRPAIRRLQRELRRIGYKSVPYDGKYGVRTRSAVKRFQRKRGIKASRVAVVTPATWKRLFSEPTKG